MAHGVKAATTVARASQSQWPDKLLLRWQKDRIPARKSNASRQLQSLEGFSQNDRSPPKTRYQRVSPEGTPPSLAGSQQEMREIAPPYTLQAVVSVLSGIKTGTFPKPRSVSVIPKTPALDRKRPRESWGAAKPPVPPGRGDQQPHGAQGFHAPRFGETKGTTTSKS